MKTRKECIRASAMVLVVAAQLNGFAETLGSIPDSRYQYAEDCEYQGLLELPWVENSTKKVKVNFRCPKCMESAEVAKRYEETSLYSGKISLVGGNVVLGFSLQVLPDNGNEEFRMVRFAGEDEAKSRAFLRKFTSLTGRKDVVEIGMTKVSGLNALWATTRMERRLANQIIYRGVNRMYMIPLRNEKKAVAVNILVGALGVDEIPYADFKAFLPVGEKILKSMQIKEAPKWKFW